MTLEHLQSWIGKTEVCADVVTARVVDGLRATLDARDAAIPIALHWCLAPTSDPASRLGFDGHAALGGFLPPVPLPRRMWAESEVTFHDAIRIMDTVERVSRIADVQMKTGRTGQLCFVTVLHEFSTARGLAVRERQVIVYREAHSPRTVAESNAAEARESTWTQSVQIDAVRLFRYSALTFNGHRIHYDRDFCRHEGYDGLLVHAPLQASLLAEFGRSLRANAPPRAFTFRAVRPLYDSASVVTLHARECPDGLDLWVTDPAGNETMTARFTA